MVWDDTTDKIGVSVSQCGHEFSEGLLVELAHCTKHALFCFIGSTKSCLVHSCHLVQAHDTVHYRCGESRIRNQEPGNTVTLHSYVNECWWKRLQTKVETNNRKTNSSCCMPFDSRQVLGSCTFCKIKSFLLYIFIATSYMPFILHAVDKNSLLMSLMSKMLKYCLGALLNLCYIWVQQI